MRHKQPNGGGAGFTLIEMLTVIAIIGVLAGMIMPALSKVREKTQIALAKKDMQVLIGAINQYNAQYGRFPASQWVRESLSDNIPDFTYGTYKNFDNDKGATLLKAKLPQESLPAIGPALTNSRYGRNNAEVVAILNDWTELPDGSAIQEATKPNTVNQNHSLNPQKQVFLDGFKQVGYVRKAGGGSPAIYKAGGIGPDGVLRDPWGNPYIVTLDLNFDNRCMDAFYRLNEVSVDTGNLGLNGLKRTKAGDFFEVNTTVMVWSFGPDGKVNTSKRASRDENKDNVLSWK